MNLARNLERSAFFFPNHPAIRQAGTELTYAQLNEQASRIATGLIKMGITPGDHVGLCSLNSADWVAFYFGVLKAGAVAVTLSGLLTGDELAPLVRHAKPRFILTSENKLAELERLKSFGGLAKVTEPLPGSQEGLLGQVFTDAETAGGAVGERANQRLIPRHDLSERFAILSEA